MDEHSLYDNEYKIIKKSEEVINNAENADNPMLNEYRDLSDNYQRLFKQFSRIVKLNDKQQSQLKNSQDEIIKYNEELKDLNATKDKFFSIISHDLKSPINSFLNLSTLLVDYIDRFSKEDIIDMAQNVKRSGDNLLKLLENLLNWARLQMKRAEFQPQKCSLNMMVSDITYIMSNRITTKQIKISSDIDENMVLMADVNMLNSILQNLITNAIKFTDKDGEIVVAAKVKEKVAEISITDTGVGISEENIKKLFRIDVIYTNTGTDQEKGTGLGLILCKEMIEKHGCEIRVESELGKGTSFIFTIPVFE